MHYDFYGSKTHDEMVDYLNAELYLDGKTYINESCYFFCLRRNQDFNDDIATILNFKFTISAYFDNQLLDSPFKNIHPYPFNSFLYHYSRNHDLLENLLKPLKDHFTDEIDSLKKLSETHKAFIFKWRILPPLNIDLPFCFAKYTDQLEFDDNFSQIIISEDHQIKLDKSLYHRLEIKELNSKIKRLSGNDRDNLHETLRAYKIYENLNNRGEWPKRDIMEKLVFRESISAIADHDYHSRLSKLMNNAKSYIDNPLIVLKSIQE